METHKPGTNPQQPSLGMMERLIGVLPHLVAFGFTTYIVWMARPGSSRFYILRLKIWLLYLQVYFHGIQH